MNPNYAIKNSHEEWIKNKIVDSKLPFDSSTSYRLSFWFKIRLKNFRTVLLSYYSGI